MDNVKPFRALLGARAGVRPPARPLVTVSYAQTLDGRLATLTGSSQWISEQDSLRFAHHLRATHDAILVGCGTVCRDDPRLTVRLAEGDDPLRVVVDSGLRSPLSCAVLGKAAGGTLLAVTGRAPEERCAAARELGATVLRLPEDGSGRVNLPALLGELDGLGISSVMVEGGASIITALLREQLVDRMAVCLAPKVLGRGIPAVGDLGIRDLDYALALEEVSVESYGVDLVIDGRVVYPDARDASDANDAGGK